MSQAQITFKNNKVLWTDGKTYSLEGQQGIAFAQKTVGIPQDKLTAGFMAGKSLETLVKEFIRENPQGGVTAGGVPNGFKPLSPAEQETLKAKDINAYVAYLQAEIDWRKAQAAVRNKVSVYVSEKGAISVYGMGRFPVTLYKTQWERLLADDVVSKIRQIIADGQGVNAKGEVIRLADKAE